MAKYDITKEATEDLYKIWAYTIDTWSADICSSISFSQMAAS